jgi:hypothetical protein
MRHPGLTLLLLLVACGDSGTSPTITQPEPEPPLVSTVELDTTVLAFSAYGDTTQLTATAKDTSGKTLSASTFKWSTSAASVATVSSAGLVTSVAAGTATITATSGTVSATASVTATDDLYPVVTWSTTSSSYRFERYGTVAVNVTATDNYLIDSVSFFIDEVSYASTGCGNATKYSNIPITGVTATCYGDGKSVVIVFTWNSIESSGGKRDLKIIVYDQNGHAVTRTGSVNLMHQPSLKFVNHLYENVELRTTTSTGVLLSADTVAAQDSISIYGHIPTTDSVRVSSNLIRSLRADGAPYGQERAGYWEGRSPLVAHRYDLSNRMWIDGTLRYWYYPRWRNSGGIITVPFVDKTLSSEVDICWNSTQARFVCEIPSDSVLYGTGYYLLTDSSDLALAKKVNSVSASVGYWHTSSAASIESRLATDSGAIEFHCTSGANSCGEWLSGYGAASEKASAPKRMLADDVTIAGESHIFPVYTDHLRVGGKNNAAIFKPSGTDDIILESVMDSSPITLPIVGETILNRVQGVPPR